MPRKKYMPIENIMPKTVYGFDEIMNCGGGSKRVKDDIVSVSAESLFNAAVQPVHEVSAPEDEFEQVVEELHTATRWPDQLRLMNRQMELLNQMGKVTEAKERKITRVPE